MINKLKKMKIIFLLICLSITLAIATGCKISNNERVQNNDYTVKASKPTNMLPKLSSDSNQVAKITFKTELYKEIMITDKTLLNKLSMIYSNASTIKIPDSDDQNNITGQIEMVNGEFLSFVISTDHIKIDNLYIKSGVLNFRKDLLDYLYKPSISEYLNINTIKINFDDIQLSILIDSVTEIEAFKFALKKMTINSIEENINLISIRPEIAIFPNISLTLNEKVTSKYLVINNSLITNEISNNFTFTNIESVLEFIDSYYDYANILENSGVYQLFNSTSVYLVNEDTYVDMTSYKSPILRSLINIENAVSFNDENMRINLKFHLKGGISNVTILANSFIINGFEFRSTGVGRRYLKTTSVP